MKIETEVTEVRTSQNVIVFKGHGWITELSQPDEKAGKAVLTVTHQHYSTDPGAGQNLVVSAFFRACEIWEVNKDGEIVHSGGYVRCEVSPESEEEISE